MPNLCLCIDIDNTLLVKSKYVIEKDKNLRHLEEVVLSFTGCRSRFYAINRSAMQVVFAALVAQKEVQIVFISLSEYDRSILFALENLYALPEGSLSGCVFINGLSPYNVPQAKKGKMIVAMQKNGLIPEDARITLLDDSRSQLTDASEHGFDYIAARGFPYGTPGNTIDRVSSDYIYEIIEAFDLGVRLHPSDPCEGTMKRPRLIS